MSPFKLTLPYSLVKQVAADLMLGSSYANSTYFDAEVLTRIEHVLTYTLERVFDKSIKIEFIE